MSVMPLWPWMLFAYIEPVMLVWGAVTILSDPGKFAADGVPYLPQIKLHESTELLLYMLANVYVLLALIPIFLAYFTDDPRAMKALLAAIAIADCGHIASAGYMLGWDRFLNVAGWNDMAWGNIGVSAFLFVNRVLYVLGVFDDGPGARARKQKRT